jgi:GTP-binding protein
VRWGDTKINVVDTPGHSDFGGEVERILRMVDGVILLVDAAEGPMPQTRFVTRKALALGLQPVVIINKIDRGDAEPMRVHDEVLELFMELDATDAQLDAPFLYAVAREGWAVHEPGETGSDLGPLFDTIIERVPAPEVDVDGPFRMLVSTLDYSPYLGRMAIGRIDRGKARLGESVTVAELGNEASAKTAKVSKLFAFEGLQRAEVEEASAGELVAIAGLSGIEIGVTLCDPENVEPLEGIKVENPTVSVDFIVNTSPFAGKEGKFVTSRQLRERLFRELETNIALRVEDTDSRTPSPSPGADSSTSASSWRPCGARGTSSRSRGRG